MTDEQILQLPHVQGFLSNFARYCGTSREVFTGQLLVAIKEVLAESERKAAALDWLEENKFDARAPSSGVDTWELWDWEEQQQICIGQTLLEAIETAMRAEKGNGGQDGQAQA